MAGTRFDKATLLTEVEANYNRRLDAENQKITDILALDDTQRLASWRASAERAVIELAKRVKDVADSELSHFNIPSPPWPGDQKYELRDAERRVNSLIERKNKALAYVRALKDDDGVVEVYAADLRRIGYEA